MRRLADSVVNFLLRLAPWYRPEELDKAEERSTEAVTDSRDARIEAEKAIGRRLGSYHRIRIG